MYLYTRMNIQDKIQLNENRNIDSVNVDTTIKIGLDVNTDLNIDYNIQNILDVTQIFDDERQATTKYRIHGEFEYFSILNGLFKDYTNLEFFFSLLPASADTKTIYTDLKIYLVKPSTGFTELIPDQRYIKNYDIIGEIDEIIPAGFSKNIFNEQQYSFIVNFEVDIRDMVDGLGFPITELGLYVEYQPSTNGVGDPETMETTTYNITGGTIIQNFTPIPLNIGDTIVGDVIEYNKPLFQQTNFLNPSTNKESILEQFIITPYEDTTGSGTGTGELKWKYRPILPIRLRFFENEVRRANTGSTDYELVSNIPSYATPIDADGNYVWRNLLDNGFFDPIDEIGVSFPFINQRHYVFNNIVFKVQPDLEDVNTENVFNEILFPDNTLDSATPNSNLDNIGDICN